VIGYVDISHTCCYGQISNALDCSAEQLYFQLFGRFFSWPAYCWVNLCIYHTGCSAFVPLDKEESALYVFFAVGSDYWCIAGRLRQFMDVFLVHIFYSFVM